MTTKTATFNTPKAGPLDAARCANKGPPMSEVEYLEVSQRTLVELMQAMTANAAKEMQGLVAESEARVLDAVRRAALPDRLLDADEVAAWLDVTERYVWALAREGELPCVEIGKYRKFDRADVAAFIEARKEGARNSRAHVEEPRTRPAHKSARTAKRRIWCGRLTLH